MGKRQNLLLKLLVITVLLQGLIFPSIGSPVEASVTVPPDDGTEVIDNSLGGNTGDTTVNSDIDQANNANNTSSTMLEYFREANAISVSNLSKDEVRVYGIFLSNFTKPYETKLGDLKDPTKVASKVSDKFFGTTANSEAVQEVNSKVHEAIYNGLTQTPLDWGIYSTKQKITDKEPMHGSTLLLKIAQKSGHDGALFNAKGEQIMNMDNRVDLSAWKILFGYSPTMFLKSSTGIRGVEDLFMDGFGNIWGMPKGETNVDNYVLIMPATMNPILYDGRLPLANVYATGAILDVDNEKLNKGGLTAYYNYLNHQSSNNAMHIMGIQSPSAKLGATDDIIEGTYSQSSKGTLKGLTAETADDISKGTIKVMLTFNVQKVDNSAVKDIGSLGLNDKESSNLAGRLMNTELFSFNELAEKMYFFDTRHNSSNTAKDSSFGSFDDPQSMITEFNLFNYSNNGKMSFYNNAYASSQMMQAIEKAVTNKDGKKQAESAGLKGKEATAYGQLLQGEKITGSTDELAKAVRTVGGSKKYVYNTVEASTHFTRQNTDGFWGTVWFGSATANGVFLTTKDHSLGVASTYANDNVFKDLTKYRAAKINPVPPFEACVGGLVACSGGIGKHTADAQLNRVSELIYVSYAYRLFTTNKSYLTNIKANNTPAGTSISSSVGSGTTGTDVADVVNNFAGMYWAYLREFLTASIDASGKVTATAFQNDKLPNMTISVDGQGFGVENLLQDNNSSGNQTATKEEKMDELTQRIYDLTSSEINATKMGYVKAMGDSTVLGLHRSITNSWNEGTYSISTVNGKGYQPSFNYVKSPSLSEIPYASDLLSNYIYVYVLIMLIVLLFVFITVLFKVYTILQGLIIFALMSLILLIPQYFVGGVSSLTNVVSDNMLSERFNYWAIVGHQTKESALAKADASGDLDALIENSMQQVKETQGDNDKASGNAVQGVTIKWMAPKRTDVYSSIFTSEEDQALLETRGSLFKWLMASYFYEEEFVYDDPMATYLYKSYNTVASDAKTNYDNYLNKQGELSLSGFRSSVLNASSNDALYDENTFKILDVEEYDYTMVNEGMAQTQEDKTYLKYASAKGEADSYRYWGISNDTIATNLFKTEYELAGAGITLAEDHEDYHGFALNTESPYYYFYNVFKNRYASEGSTFKASLLKDSTFKVTEEDAPLTMYGELRDFLDLEGLFSYVIPYLREGNEYVNGWTDKFGNKPASFNFNEASGVTSTPVPQDAEGEGVQGIGETENLPDGGSPPSKDDMSSNELYAYQKAHKEALGEVWKAYSPWVDQLYSVRYGHKIHITDKEKGEVPDPLNPSYYAVAGRPMVFSPAHLGATYTNYGYLSQVEEKLIEVTEKTYEDLMYLNNYRDFSEESLISMGAMMATFNFNEVFSEINVFGNSSLLYPQSFELKNFNYDAYMRMAIMKASGEGIQDDKDLYERVLTKTSLFTGVSLIIKDLLGVYGVPIARVLVLSLLFFLTFVFCVVSLLTPPEQILGRLMTVLVKPALIYTVATIAFTFLIAMFLGEGANAYVGTSMATFNLSDPTTSMWGMIVIDAIYIIVLGWLAFKLFKELKNHIILTWSLLKSIGSQILSNIKGAINKLTTDGLSTKGNVTNTGRVETQGGQFGGTLKRGVSLGGTIRGTKAVINRRQTKQRQKLQDEVYTEWLNTLSSGKSGTQEGSTDTGTTNQSTQRDRVVRRNSQEENMSSYKVPNASIEGIKEQIGNTGKTVKNNVGDVVKAATMTAKQSPAGVYATVQYNNLKDKATSLGSTVATQATDTADMTTAYTNDKVRRVKRASTSAGVYVGGKLKGVADTVMGSKTFNFITSTSGKVKDKMGNEVKTTKESIVNSTFSRNLQEVRSERTRGQLQSGLKRSKDYMSETVSELQGSNEETLVVSVTPKRKELRKKKRRKKKGRNRSRR